MCRLPRVESVDEYHKSRSFGKVVETLFTTSAGLTSLQIAANYDEQRSKKQEEEEADWHA